MILALITMILGLRSWQGSGFQPFAGYCERCTRVFPGGASIAATHTEMNIETSDGRMSTSTVAAAIARGMA